MTPEKGDSFISIPVTFDKMSKGRILTRAKFLWSALIFGCQFFIWVLFLLAGSTFWKIAFPFIGITCWSLITRFILLRETYFKQKREELKKQEYMFGTSVLWNVNSIDEAYPYFVRFGSGLLGLFVQFDKDVIVGRPEDDEYYHYEAIADAYQEMCKRGINCMHIDYMDICGKDDRMVELFHLAANTENPDLKAALTRFYDNIEGVMNRAYASYDVYCFYSNQREELFWEDVQGVIGVLNQANYVRSRILNKDEIGKLAKSLFNMDDFSVAQACDVIYKDQSTNFLKVIWTERDGKRTIVNKTTEEIAEAKRVMDEERRLKRVKQKQPKLKKGEVAPDDRISLWGDPLPEIERPAVQLDKKGRPIKEKNTKERNTKEKKQRPVKEKKVKGERKGIQNQVNTNIELNKQVTQYESNKQTEQGTGFAPPRQEVQPKKFVDVNMKKQPNIRQTPKKPIVKRRGEPKPEQTSVPNQIVDVDEKEIDLFGDN